MDFGMFAAWMVVGVLAGWVAGFVMKGGGYGPIGDMVLGLFGGVAGGWIFRTLSGSAGIVPTEVAALAGAVIVVVAQREFWHTTRLAT